MEEQVVALTEEVKAGVQYDVSESLKLKAQEISKLQAELQASQNYAKSMVSVAYDANLNMRDIVYNLKPKSKRSRGCSQNIMCRSNFLFWTKRSITKRFASQDGN